MFQYRFYNSEYIQAVVSAENASDIITVFEQCMPKGPTDCAVFLICVVYTTHSTIRLVKYISILWLCIYVPVTSCCNSFEVLA
jgi:hypothetical protein